MVFYSKIKPFSRKKFYFQKKVFSVSSASGRNPLHINDPSHKKNHQSYKLHVFHCIIIIIIFFFWFQSADSPQYVTDRLRQFSDPLARFQPIGGEYGIPMLRRAVCNHPPPSVNLDVEKLRDRFSFFSFHSLCLAGRWMRNSNWLVIYLSSIRNLDEIFNFLIEFRKSFAGIEFYLLVWRRINWNKFWITMWDVRFQKLLELIFRGIREISTNWAVKFWREG